MQTQKQCYLRDSQHQRGTTIKLQAKAEPSHSNSMHQQIDDKLCLRSQLSQCGFILNTLLCWSISLFMITFEVDCVLFRMDANWLYTFLLRFCRIVRMSIDSQIKIYMTPFAYHLPHLNNEQRLHDKS